MDPFMYIQSTSIYKVSEVQCGVVCWPT